MSGSSPLQLRSCAAQGSVVPSSPVSAIGVGPPCLCQLPGLPLLSPLTTAVGVLLAVPAAGTGPVGCGLPGVSHPSLWLSGRYPNSHARSGCADTMMPITAEGSPHLSGMGKAASPVCRGWEHWLCAYICIPPPHTPALSRTPLLSLLPLLSLTHALGTVTASHAHVGCVNAAHGWLCLHTQAAGRELPLGICMQSPVFANALARQLATSPGFHQEPRGLCLLAGR